MFLVSTVFVGIPILFFQWVRCNAPRQDLRMMLDNTHSPLARAYQIAFPHVAALTSGQPTACSETVNRLAPHTWLGGVRSVMCGMEMARVPDSQGYGIVGSQISRIRDRRESEFLISTAS